MNYELLKAELVKAAIEMLYSQADAAKQAMDEHQQAANDYGAPKDRYDSFRTQNMRKRDMFAQQYQRALDNLEILKKIDFKKSQNTIGPGSLVVSTRSILLIAVGLGKIRIMDKDCFVISPMVPLYKAISGLKRENEFTFNGVKSVILDVV